MGRKPKDRKPEPSQFPPRKTNQCVLCGMTDGNHSKWCGKSK